MPRDPQDAKPRTGMGCCGSGGCCGPTERGPSDGSIGEVERILGAEYPRRDFLKLGAVAAAGAVAGAWPPRGAIAGPFAIPGPDEFPIPADKHLDAAWIRSLTERGEPTVYTSGRKELGHIGMPIGGICCGQVYLGGDGKLWHWDIFNLRQAPEWASSNGPLYAKPARPTSPIEQGFAVRVTSGGVTRDRVLDASGFSDIEFRGQYPIGLVRYADERCPVRVELEAFSPFCPLDEAMSGIPAIVLNYTITNTSSERIEASIAGWLENGVCKVTGREQSGARISRVVRENRSGKQWTSVEFSARPARAQEQPAPPTRPDIVFEDWEKGTYEGWTVTGTAFGDKPRNLADIAQYQGNLNAQGNWTVNTHETRHGEDVTQADAHIGTLTSRVFAIEREFVSFRIGGGKHPGQTCVNLLIDGAAVRTATGADSNKMHLENFDVREFAGREARIQIVDGWTGAWGQIGCDEIVFCDKARHEPYDMERAADFGSMSLSVIGGEDQTRACAAMSAISLPACFDGANSDAAAAESPLGGANTYGCVSHRGIGLEPGESRTITFIIAWWFPNPDRDQLSFLTDSANLRRWYAGRFASAAEVRSAAQNDLEHLADITRRWRDTWYDSTLPHWFLDRTFATVSTAATATCWRFDNGRFYGWEGTYCCAGTCTHVWHYAHGLARVFPALERSAREMVDFGLAFHDETGRIDYRAEAARDLAVDGQCGTILRAYREHQMSGDDRFLRAVWARVKKALELMLARDLNADGILDGEQYNTLDTSWYGQIAWLTSMYLAAARAGQAMAIEMDDAAFAARCAEVVERGSASMVAKLYNGEYFVHITDPAHPEANSTGTGCHIDQLLGQSWMHQVGLDRIVPLEQSRSALASLYKYNFAPDIGPYREKVGKVIKGGRWYAMSGEGGLLMCTWPKGGAEAAAGKSGDAWAAGYFNECMSGFEHQVASHMIWEGRVTQGLAITRMIHDRYHAARRNPWNEVECSNHYARAMACYGSFIAATGFEHHGPRASVGFAPRLTPANFKSAFICAGAWGQFRQTRGDRAQTHELEVRWGTLRVGVLGFEVEDGFRPGSALVRLGDAEIKCSMTQEGSRVRITLPAPLTVAQGKTLRIEFAA